MKPNYKIQNYCLRCDKVYPKDVFVCEKNHPLRSMPSAGLRRKKYLVEKAVVK